MRSRCGPRDQRLKPPQLRDPHPQADLCIRGRLGHELAQAGLEQGQLIGRAARRVQNADAARARSCNRRPGRRELAGRQHQTGERPRHYAADSPKAP